MTVPMPFGCFARPVFMAKKENIVEEAYSATVQCLLGNQAMEERREIFFPEEYKIPYMKF